MIQDINYIILRPPPPPNDGVSAMRAKLRAFRLATAAAAVGRSSTMQSKKKKVIIYILKPHGRAHTFASI